MSDRTPGDKAGEGANQGAKRPAMPRSELIRRLADAYPIHPPARHCRGCGDFLRRDRGRAGARRVVSSCEVSAPSRPRQGEHAAPATREPAPPSRLGQEIIWFSTPAGRCTSASTLVPRRGRAGRLARSIIGNGPARAGVRVLGPVLTALSYEGRGTMTDRPARYPSRACHFAGRPC